MKAQAEQVSKKGPEPSFVFIVIDRNNRFIENCYKTLGRRLDFPSYTIVRVYNGGSKAQHFTGGLQDILMTLRDEINDGAPAQAVIYNGHGNWDSGHSAAYLFSRPGCVRDVPFFTDMCLEGQVGNLAPYMSGCHVFAATSDEPGFDSIFSRHLIELLVVDGGIPAMTNLQWLELINGLEIYDMSPKNLAQNNGMISTTPQIQL